MSRMQVRAQLRNFAKMRVKGALANFRQMLTDKKYSNLKVLHSNEEAGIEQICAIMETVLDSWRKR